MLLECVLASECFKQYDNFRYCVQDGVDKECKALRYDYHLCRKGQVFWVKSHCKDDRR
jgi:cytochrome c oxidase assembly factor 5